MADELFIPVVLELEDAEQEVDDIEESTERVKKQSKVVKEDLQKDDRQLKERRRLIPRFLQPAADVATIAGSAKLILDAADFFADIGLPVIKGAAQQGLQNANVPDFIKDPILDALDALEERIREATAQIPAIMDAFSKTKSSVFAQGLLGAAPSASGIVSQFDQFREINAKEIAFQRNLKATANRDVARSISKKLLESAGINSQ